MDDLQLNWNSEAWQSVAAWARKEAARKSMLLEDPKLPYDETQVVRGELRMIRNLLAQPDLAAQVKVPYFTNDD